MVVGILLVGSLFLSSTGVFAQETKIIRFFTSETDPASLEAYKTIMSEFQKQHPDVQILLELGTYRDEMTILKMQLAAGNPADVFSLEMGEVPTLAKMEYLLPLNDVIDDIGEEDFKPNTIFKVEGSYYAVPYAGDGDALWIRKDLMEKYGVKSPGTWDEWLDYSRKLTLDSNGDGQVDIYGSIVPAGIGGRAVYLIEELTWAAGGQVFNRDLEVVYDSPESVETIKFLAKLAEYSPPGITNYHWWESFEGYIMGRAAMAVYPGRVLGQLEQNSPELVEKADVVLLPKGPKLVANYVNWNSYASARITRYPRVTKDFLKFLITGDNAVSFCNTVPAHNIPALWSVDKNPKLWEPPLIQKNPDIAKVFFEEVPLHAGMVGGAGQFYQGKFNFGIINPYSAGVTGGDYTLSRVLQQHLIGGMSAEEAVKWGAKRIHGIKQKYDELFE